MDFLKSAIQEEISKKRKVLESIEKKGEGENKKQKYKKARLEAEEAKRKDLERQQAKANEKENQEKSEEETETFNIPMEECIRRLRAMGQPIRLFAETDKQCKLRLRALELMDEQQSEKQGRNEFMKTLEEMEAHMRLDDLKQKRGVTIEDKKKTKKQGPAVVPIQIELISSDIDRLYSQIYAYFAYTLEEWEEYMAARPEEEKRSVPGKRAAVLQKQAAEYIKPLMRQLKKGTLEPDVLARVAEIAQRMQKRLYRDAQDSYLQLSIGNAPWPIGVTMVGIHERSAREKISSSQVAHVLNDETSRKWIQSVKRLMTFAQTKYPPYTLSQIS